jgi:hypothetical protein
MRKIPRVLYAIALLIIGAVLPAPAVGQESQQTISLRAGWNSIWLMVDPVDRDPEVVFDGVPIEEVWCFFPTTRPVEFINDPQSGLFNREGWSVYIPAGDEAFLTNLHAVFPRRPYLIKADRAATLTISGRPVHEPYDWRPGSFNLVGFPAEPGVGGGSHVMWFYNQPNLRDAPKYRLTPEGTWARMLSGDTIRRGEAYWVYCEEESTYTAPLELEAVPGGSEVNFGSGGYVVRLILRNRGAFAGPVTVANSSNLPLLRAVTQPDGTKEWQPLTSFTTAPLGSETSLMLELGLDRAALSSEISGHLEITGFSAMITLPVSAKVPQQALLGNGFAGLWVGNVELGQVTETASAELKETPASFNMRLILHVDAAGQASLLKSAIMMWQNGENAGDQGQYVLLTDDSLIPNFQGARLRDGRPVGFRVSSIGYDFPQDHLPLTGTFGEPGQSLTGEIVIDPFSPTHPYRHKYHPDHDGLTPTFDEVLIGENQVSVNSIISLANDPARQAEIDAWQVGTAPLPEDLVAAFAQQFDGADAEELRALNPSWVDTDNFARPGEKIKVPLTADQEELWTITRNLTLTFESQEGVFPSRADTVQGTYEETIQGMHRETLRTAGTFTMNRVNPISTLNPAP